MRFATHIVLALLVLFFISTPAHALVTEWDWTLSGQTMIDGTGTFSASESNSGAAFTGTFRRWSSGFIALTITAISDTGGGLTPGVNSVVYAVEIPGVALIVQPVLTGETQIAAMSGQSTCPPATNLYTSWVFTQWNTGYNYNVNNALQPAMGDMDWNASVAAGSGFSQGQATLNQAFNLVNLTALPFAAPLMTMRGTCDGNGVMNVPGTGSRGGRVWFTNKGGIIFKNNAGQLVLGLSRTVIPHIRHLAGAYAGFRWSPSGGAAGVIPMGVTINAQGSSVTSHRFLDPTDVNNGTDPGFTDTISINQTVGINSPINGMVSGTLTHDGETGNVACSTMLNVVGRNALFCVGQTPTASATKEPYNFLAVSSSTTYLTISEAPVYNYGVVIRNTAPQHVFTLSNSGQVAATNIQVVDFGVTSYFGQSENCNASLSPGETCEVTVTFNANTVGRYVDTLKITYDSGSVSRTAEVAVRGIVKDVAYISGYPSTNAFGNVAVGGTTEKTIEVVNGGGVPATALEITGMSAPYAFKGGAYPGTGGTCGTELAGDSTPCTVVVTVTPGSAGSHDQTWSLNYHDGVTSQSYSMVNTATAFNPAVLAIQDNGNGWDFGSEAAGSKKEFTYKLSNSGSVAVTAIASSSIGTGFNFKGGSYPGTGGSCRVTLAAGANCTLVVEFSPVAAEGYLGTLDFDYHDGAQTQNASQAIEGIGLGGAFLSADIVDHTFAAQPLGVSATATITLTNIGDTGATGISGAALAAPFYYKAETAFPGDGGTCGTTLAPSASCTVKVQFDPIQIGLYNDMLSVTYDRGDALTRSVSTRLLGSAVRGPEVTMAYANGVPPTEVSFGVVAINSTNQVSVTVKNIGNSTAYFDSWTSGGMFSHVAPSGGWCPNLNPGQYCDIVVKYIPTAAGDHVGAFTLNYNDGNGNVRSVQIPLRGKTPDQRGYSLDTSFATNGKADVDYDSTFYINDLETQSDGKILVAGSVMVDNHRKLAVARLNENGTTDSSFGTGGIMTICPTVNYFCNGGHVALQSDGKIILSGIWFKVTFAYRLSDDGSVDTSFGTNGYIAYATEIYPQVTARAVVRSDDRVVILRHDGMKFFSEDGAEESPWGGSTTLAVGNLKGSQTLLEENNIYSANNAGGNPQAVSLYKADGTTGSTSSVSFSTSESFGDDLYLFPQRGNRMLMVSPYGKYFSVDRSTGSFSKVTISSDAASLLPHGVLRPDGVFILPYLTPSGLRVSQFELDAYSNILNRTLSPSLISSIVSPNGNSSMRAKLLSNGKMLVAVSNLSVTSQVSVLRLDDASYGYGKIVPSIASHDFGAKLVGSSTTKSIELKNTGSVAATSITLVTAPAGAFSLTGVDGSHPLGGDCGTSLAADSTCTITASFDPTTRGTQAGGFVYSYDDGSGVKTVAINLNGSVRSNRAELGIMREQYNNEHSEGQEITFSGAYVGYSPQFYAYVRNFGGVGATSVTAAFQDSGSDYSIVTNYCTNLAVGASCSILLQLSPTSAGVHENILRVTYHDGTAERVSQAKVSIVVAPTPTFTITPASVSLGSNIAVGEELPIEFTMTNTSAGTIHIYFHSVTGISAADVQLYSNDCQSVAPSATCTMTVSFKPSTEEVRRNVIAFYSGITYYRYATLTAQPTGLARANLTSSSQDFGTTLTGATHSRTITLTNTGGAPITNMEEGGTGLSGTFTFLGGAYPGTGGTCGTYLAAAASCDIVVEAHPTAEGSFSGSVKVAYHDGTEYKMNSTSLAIAALDEVMVATGVASPFAWTGGTQSVTFTNNSSYPVNVDNAVGPTDVGMSQSCGTVYAGLTCYVNVTVPSFSPSASYAGNVTLSYSLNGTAGTAASPITQTAPTAANLVLTVDNSSLSAGGNANVTVTNQGEASASGLSFGLDGTGTGMTLTSNMCDGQTLATGQYCLVSVAMGAAQLTSTTVHVVATYSDFHNNVNGKTSNSPNISYTAATVANISLSGSTSGAVAQGSPLQVTLTNTGQWPASSLQFNPTSNDGSLSFTNNCGAELTGGSTCTVDISYSGGGNESATASFNFSYSDGVNGQQTANAEYTAYIPPAVLSFGGDTSNAMYSTETRTITLSNQSGAATATNIVLNITPSGSEMTMSSTDCGSTLSGGQSCNIYLYWDGNNGGGASNIQVGATYNDPGSAQSVSTFTLYSQ